jgi:hypothetical protein
MFVYEHNTIEEAYAGLKSMEEDIAADAGKEYLDTAYGDIVNAVAWDCAPGIRAELFRTTGTQDQYPLLRHATDTAEAEG